MKAAAALLALGILLGITGCRTALPTAEPRARASLDPAQVARGAELAAVGNCRSCHTRHGGPGYAGGFPMHSPFGIIYTTNITPDPETGIGRWSAQAFHRAMREGIRADGQHLYPAFPYDRFTKASDADIAALYAYLMSIPPVRYEPPANALVFPFNVRAGIAAWKRLHFRPGAMPQKAGELGRGEYLVEGLGHCGSCHSPRTKLFGEDLKRAYDGGLAEGWHAYAINEKNKAPVPWDAAALAQYLRTGYHAHHGIARGTMGIVAHDLAEAAPADVQAMAAYVAALMKPPSAERVARGRELLKDPRVSPKAAGAGGEIYERVCLGCHRGRGELPWNGIALPLSIGLTGESPRNVVNVVLHGISPPPNGQTGPTMPGFMGALDDAQVEALLHWMRANLTTEPPWTDVREAIAEAKRMKPTMLLFPPGGTGTKP